MPYNTQETAEDPIIEINNLDAFAGMVLTWHDAVMQDIKNLMLVPDGTPVSIELVNGESSSQVALTGDALVAFKAGVLSAMAAVEKLPFERIIEEPGQQASNVDG